MISILIDLKTFPNEMLTKDDVSSKLRHRALFGRVTFRNADSTSSELLTQVMYGLAGSCDVDLEFSGSDLNAAIDYLNLGVRRLIVTAEQFLLLSECVSTERLALRMHSLADLQADQWNRVSCLYGPQAVLSETTKTPEAEWNLTDVPTSDATVFRERVWQVFDSSILNNPALLAQTIWARLRSDRSDGLVPTIVSDPLGRALGLCYSNQSSLERAIALRRGVYWSRSRNSLWEKGESSGQTQRLIQMEFDCDHDTIRLTVEQTGGFCHQGTYGCFGDSRSAGCIERHLAERLVGADQKSITLQLANNPTRLLEKLHEETRELLETGEATHAEWEFADVLYFSLIALKSKRGNLSAAFAELARRSLRISRRVAKGDIC